MASSPSTASNKDAFFANVEKSRVLTSEQLEQARDVVNDAADSKAAARNLYQAGLLTHWQARQLYGGFYDLTLGKYTLLEQLAAGRLGRIFLAKHGSLGRKVAIRTLSRRYSTNPKATEQFLAESRAAAALDHRNVVHVHDVNVDEATERYYEVMDYIDGPTLEGLVEKEGPLPPELAADYTRQTAEALAYAHEQKINHGALSPSKLMVDEQHNVKMLDLCVSHVSSGRNGGNGNENEEKAAARSRLYRAPEQLSGDEASPRADLYALGGVMWFLLTGKAPPSDDEGPQLSKTRDDVPADLAVICEKLLAADPEQRPESAAQVADGLWTWLEEHAPEPEEIAAAEGGGEEGESDHKPSIVAAFGDRPGGRSGKTKAAASSGIGSGKSSGKKKTSSPVETKEAPQRDNTARKKWLLIGGAGAAALALIAVGVAAGVMLAGGGGEVAQSDTSPAEAESGNEPAASSASDDDTAQDQESSFPAIGSGSEGSAEDESNGENASQPPDDQVAGAGEQNENGGDEDNPEEQPAEEEDEDENSLAALLGGNSDSEKQPQDEPAAGDDAENPPGEEGGKEPASESSNSESSGDGENPSAEKPDKPKEKPKKPEEKKPQNPFRGFPTAVNLPPAPSDPQVSSDSLEWSELGKVDVGPNDLVIIRLEGGDRAYKGERQSFTLRNAEDGRAERDWEILLSGARGSSEPNVIAQLTLENEEKGLRFRWTPNAAADPAAPYLVNCLLSLSAGPASHEVALRKPVETQPMAIDLHKPVTAEIEGLELVPDPDTLKVEITSMKGFPKANAAQKTLDANGGGQVVPLADGQTLLLQLSANMRRSTLRLTATPYFKLTATPEPLKLTPNALQQAANQLTARSQATMQTIGNFRNFKKKASDPQKKRIDSQILLGEKQVEALQASLEEVDKLQNTVAELQNGGELHFRVFYQAGAKPVVLATSSGGSGAGGNGAKE